MLKDSEIANIAAIGPLGDPPASKYERLIARAKQVPPATTVVVHPCEETALRGPIQAAEAGIIKPILVGPAAKIAAVAREHRLVIDGFEIVEVPQSDAAAAKAVELIHESKGELLMKGSLHTDELMREVTSAKTGLRTGASDQPCLHHGCARLFGDAVHQRCRDQHLSRPRRQARHRAKRDRPVHAGWPRHPARRNSFRRGDRDLENTIHHRRSRPLQDGGPWADHRRHPRWTFGL